MGPRLSLTRVGDPREIVLALPARETWSAGAPEPARLDPHPAVAGALALLESPAPTADPCLRAIPARHHILIVEDDPHTARVLRNTFELEGDSDWGVEVAGEGLRALELAARTSPDVVLLDVRLPDLDGAEVYRRLRAGQQTGRARVLFITAFTSLDLYQRGIEDGVLLRKPFDVQELVALVRALLAG
jgi:CheY-like chemotaxis protein